MQVLSRRMILVAAICVVSLAATKNVARSQVSEEDIAKMQEAIPAEATAKPARLSSRWNKNRRRTFS